MLTCLEVVAVKLGCEVASVVGCVSGCSRTAVAGASTVSARVVDVLNSVIVKQTV